jgi:dihydrofolate reductase
MGNIIVANIMTLDGKYEGPNKNVMMMPMDGAFDAFNLEHMKNAKAILLGENSYKFFGAFWPGMVNNDQTSDTNREFSRLYNDIQKIVISDNITDADFPTEWKDNTRVISRADAYAELQKLKDDTEGDIVMFASRMLWNDLVAHGLIDQIHFIVGNVVLGQDATPMFNEMITYDDKKTALELLSVAKCDGSNNFDLRYKVVAKA